MLLNTKGILVEEQQWYYLTNNWVDKTMDISESESNSATGIRARLLWRHSPAITPRGLLRYKD